MIALFVLLFSCKDAVTKDNASNVPIQQDVLTYNYDDELVPIEDIDVHPLIKEHFSWYTHILSPSRDPVLILSQDGVSRYQIIRIRQILEFYLTPRPDLDESIDQDAIFDAMASNKAAVLFFDDVESQERAVSEGLLELDFEPVLTHGNENIVEGSQEWQNSPPKERTMSTLYTLVYTTGIQSALSGLDEDISSLAENALENGTWQESESIYSEWSDDNALGALFISQLLSIDYGHWGDEPTAWNGSFEFVDREGFQAALPEAFSQIRAIFPSYIDHDIFVDEGFNGSFTLNTTPDVSWSTKSQYFLNVILEGENDSNLIGNSQDNRLAGNSGNNKIIGGDGEDTVVLQGPREDYDVQYTAQGTLLFDEDLTRDGADEIIEIEWVEFSDELVSISDLSRR
jgi:hypothetical protein